VFRDGNNEKMWHIIQIKLIAILLGFIIGSGVMAVYGTHLQHNPFHDFYVSLFVKSD